MYSSSAYSQAPTSSSNQSSAGGYLGASAMPESSSLHSTYSTYQQAHILKPTPYDDFHWYVLGH
jgi:hypothetical protein